MTWVEYTHTSSKEILTWVKYRNIAIPVFQGRANEVCISPNVYTLDIEDKTVQVESPIPGEKYDEIVTVVKIRESWVENGITLPYPFQVLDKQGNKVSWLAEIEI